MKTIQLLFLTAGILISSQLNSQVYIQDLNLNEVEGVTLIEVQIFGSFVTTISGLSSRIIIDYGQEPKGGIMSSNKNTCTILDKPGGEIINFRSKMHILNYFENNGWSLWDINSEPQGESTGRTYYYFRKK